MKMLMVKLEMQNSMRTSNKGKAIIAQHEGLRLKPYLDPIGIPTIGYGATYYPSTGKKVTMQDRVITITEANKMLDDMLKHYENGVLRYVQVAINQNQFDALVSFAYNVGLEAFRKSTLLKRINTHPFHKNISYQFKRWKRANGRVFKGLVNRRKQEAQLYFS